MTESDAAAQGSGSAGQTEGSAPPEQDGKNAEAAANASKQNGGTQAGVKREFFNLREKVRTEREEKESLRAELEALKAQLASSGQGQHKKADPLEDPEAYLAESEKRARKAAGEEFEARLAGHNRQVLASQSEQWLRSRSHLEDDGKAADEVAEIIAANYPDAASNPRAAARSAYLDWCEIKGVTPDLSNSSLTPPRHAKPSAAGSGSSLASKTFTPDEVREAQTKLSGKALDAYNAEVVKAAREGRYKGTAISFR